MKPSQAAAILTETGCGNAPYLTLPSSVVDALIEEADALGYRKPKGGKASRAACFHAFLTNRANSLTHQAREAISKENRSCTVTYARGRRRVTLTTW